MKTKLSKTGTYKYHKVIVPSASALMVLTFILGLLLLGLNTPNTPDTTKEVPEMSEVVTFSTSTPSEDTVNNDEFFTLPEDPRLLNLPSISTSAYIQKVGVDQNNQIAVPNNIHVVGWYINSVKPGDNGLSIIDGHVDGIQSNGVFYNLKNINKDDVFSVEYGNGTKYEFKVVDIVEVDTNEAANVLFSKRSEIKNQLNLITCIGNYDASARSYDHRLIVITEKI